MDELVANLTLGGACLALACLLVRLLRQGVLTFTPGVLELLAAFLLALALLPFLPRPGLLAVLVTALTACLGWATVVLLATLVPPSMTAEPRARSAPTVKEPVAATVVDRSELQRMRDELHLNAERLHSTFESSAIGMALVAPNGRFLAVNPALGRIVGYTAEELRASNFQSITHPDDLAADLGHVERLLAGEAASFAMEKRYFHKDGHTVWVLLTSSLLRDEAGHPIHFISQIQDITERKLAEERIRTTLDEKETLLKEVHHRVKNNLAVVCELLTLQARRSGEPRLHELLIESRNRVYSMAVVHEMLYQSQNLAAVDLPPYIERMTRHLVASYHAGETIHLSASCERLALPLEAAIPFGLLLNELVSNCLKHAFPSGRAGSIRVQLKRVGPNLELTVADDGVGFPDTAPRSTHSMGLRLIQGLAGQLKGRVEYLAGDGTQVRVTFPVPEGGSAP